MVSCRQPTTASSRKARASRPAFAPFFVEVGLVLHRQGAPWAIPDTPRIGDCGGQRDGGRQAGRRGGFIRASRIDRYHGEAIALQKIYVTYRASWCAGGSMRNVVHTAARKKFESASLARTLFSAHPIVSGVGSQACLGTAASTESCA